jgi:HK97 family phage major capsid protein
MKLAQLETDLRAKQAEIQTLVETQMRACEAHVVTPAAGDTPAVLGRVRTAEEKAAVQKLLDEGKSIRARIDGMQGDANMTAEIERLTAGMTGGGANGPRRQPRSRKSLGQQFVDSDAFAWLKKTSGTRSMGAWSSPSAELMAATLTEDAASGGDLVIAETIPGILPLLFKRLVVADLIASGTTDSNLISFLKEVTATNAADTVLEGGAKPESTLAFDAASAPVRKIATFLPVTDEMLEDVAAIRSYIDARLRLFVSLKEEDQLLNGTGIAPNILGLMMLPGLSAAVARGADSNMDAIFKQISALATAALVQPSGFVINPTNWMTIQLLKNAAGNYMGSGPWAPPQPPTLWGLPGAVTPSIAAGTSLVGDFQGSAQIFRKGGMRVEASNSHSDFFIKNLTAIRAEERLALATYREAAFGKVTGLN